MIGKTISHYKIIEKIGEGGMGIVYKALDLKLDRFVALKFLPAHMGKDNSQKQRFINEAKAASALDHPNICTIYEINEADDHMEDTTSGRIFIAMAFYDGQTLEEKIADNTLMSINETISIIMQIAQGLQRAHEKGIVHRDIKPANIIVPDEAEVKIVDFGLAKLKGQPKITKEESTLGTIAYMSPEQAEGGDIDARSDIWSLGIIFYEMLASKSPFEADYEQAVIYNILNTAPASINSLNKEVPSELDGIVQICLEKDKDKRFHTIEEFNSALLKVIQKFKYTIRTKSGEFQPAELADQKRKLSPVLSLLAGLVVILVIIAAMIYWPGSKYSSYEEAYFTKHFKESKDLSNDNRSPDNVKANRYYLLSTAQSNQGTIPKHIKQEYRDLLFQNPNSPEANYYLGLINYLSGEKRSERDSVWLLYDMAENLGLHSIYLKLDQLIFYTDYSFTQQAHEVVKALLNNFHENPEVMFEIGYLYYSASDTSKAKEYFKKTLTMYSDFVSAHLGLFRISLKQNNLESAKAYLENASEINNKDIKMVRERLRFFIKERKFGEAEEYLKASINNFGKSDVRFFKFLAELYQKQDLFEECNELILSATEIFPEDSYFSDLKKSLKERKEWIRKQEEHKNDKKMIQWSEDYEEALAKAVREEKPIFIEFYSTSNFWSKDFEEKIYPDPRIQALLNSYIPLKINGELNIDLANKYNVNWYPALLIINEKSEKINAVKYFIDPPKQIDFIEDLQKGLALYKKYVVGKSVQDQHITEVSNIKDAIILSKSKQIPIMAVVLSKESKWSKKLISKSFSNPLLQSELKNVILVMLDQAENQNLVREWNINYFPSILFLDDEGKILYQIQGNQPPDVLAGLISDLNIVMSQDKKFNERIRWFYDLDEAKINARLQKKDIFVFVNADWCPFCLRMIDHVFTDPIVINELNDQFIALELDEVKDADLLKSIGVLMFPTFLILDANQIELFRSSGAQRSQTLLANLDLHERKPIYSILGYEKYRAFYDYESLSDQFFRWDFYLSAVHALNKQIEIYPDYWQSYLSIGDAYQYLKNPQKMISYYTKASDKGAEIDPSFAENMLSAFLQINDGHEFEKWVLSTIQARNDNADEGAVLYNFYSEYFEIIEDRNSAISMAKKSAMLKPNYSEAFIRLGRLYYLENQMDEAKSYLIKANQLEKNDPRSSFYLGLIADREGNSNEKDYYFKQARIKNGRFGRKIGWRIKYESRSGYYLYPGYVDLIEQAYRYRLEIDDNPEIKNGLAYFLTTENKNLNEALQLINETLKEEPDNYNIMDTKAVILYKKGEYLKSHEIVLQYEDKINKDDLEDDPSYAYYLGRIKWAVGDTLSANKYFNYVLKHSEPDASGKRDQQELIKFLAGQNMEE